MKQLRWVLVCVAALAAAMALLVWLSPYTLGDVTVSFSFGSKPRGLLNTLGLPEGAYNAPGVSDSVLLTPHCTAGTCRVTLEARR